jgi:hypothetical protein
MLANIDILPRSSDILFQFIFLETGVPTFTITVGSFIHWIYAESRHFDNFGVCLECVYYQLYTFDLDASRTFETLGLDVE